MSRVVYDAKDVPDAHKVKVYDAICAYLLSTLPAYYTEETYTDPRYDSGVANEETEVIGLETDGSGELNFHIRIKGWADSHCFSVYLPELTRQDDMGDSAGIEID